MAVANEVCRMNAVTLAEHIRRKRLSPTEVIDAVLARMERLEPHLHAFCTPTPELAREQARRIEADIMAGRPIGPLSGVPVSHKDLILTKGVRTASGSLAYKDFIPEGDDVVVERMRAAGAVMLGKTNVPEFGYSPTGHNPVFETTRNPWNLAMTPGGSSAGAGAAVASGVGPIATGSDGGGSVRIPASFCGIYARDLGCIVEEANPGWDNPFGAFFALMFAETDLKGMREMARKYKLSGHLHDALMIPWTAEDFTNANMARKGVVRKMAQFMAHYELLLTPTLALPFPIHIQGPEKIDGYYVRPAEFLAFTFPINLTGQPAASVPAGWTDEGLPVGLQIVGRHLDDAAVLRASAAFEAASPWAGKWPPLLAQLGL